MAFFFFLLVSLVAYMHCRPDSNEDLHSLARLAEALTVKGSCLFLREGKRKNEEKSEGQKNSLKKEEEK